MEPQGAEGVEPDRPVLAGEGGRRRGRKERRRRKNKPILILTFLC